MTLSRHLLHAIALVAMLSSCAWQPAPTPVAGSPDPALEARLASFQNWSMEGKLAIRHREESHSARIQWSQQGDAFDIRLSGPAGLKATRIYGMPGGVVMEQAGLTERAGSAEVLSERLIGWPLPAMELQHWLRGLPAPGSEVSHAAYAADGTLQALAQSGWHLQFSQYQPAGALPPLPRRIDARRGDYTIILLAKQWKTAP